MIESQLNEYVAEYKISRNQVLREEAEMDILLNFSQEKISSKLIFYGGTALRLAYNSPRFSEDIDLLVVKKTNFKEFSDFIESLITEQTNWRLKDVKNKRQTMFALVNIRDDKLKHPFSIKIEAHKPSKKVKIETELLLLKSPVSINEPLLLVPKIEELRKQKELALVGRKKGRDVFDLWYIAQVMREKFELPENMPRYKKREFENELKVFLPRKYYPIISQLYEQIKKRNK